MINKLVSYVKGHTNKSNTNSTYSSQMQNMVNALHGQPLESDIKKKPEGMSEWGWDLLNSRDYVIKNDVILCSTCGGSCGQCGGGSYLNRKWYDKPELMEK